MWIGSVSVGTPAVQFQVEFDTGSSIFFLAGENFQIQPGHNRYEPTKSSTAISLEEEFSVGFRDGGAVFGMLYNDTVDIAGLTATDQTFGAASQWAIDYDHPADGLLGMALQGHCEYDARPVFQTLMEQGQTTSPIFAFKFADEGAELTLGGLKNTLFTGGVTYAPLIPEQKSWKIVFNSLRVGGRVVLKETPCIVDSVCSKYSILTLLD
jgi:hypothetical protein